MCGLAHVCVRACVRACLPPPATHQRRLREAPRPPPPPHTHTWSRIAGAQGAAERRQRRRLCAVRPGRLAHLLRRLPCGLPRALRGGELPRHQRLQRMALPRVQHGGEERRGPPAAAAPCLGGACACVFIGRSLRPSPTNHTPAPLQGRGEAAGLRIPVAARAKWKQPLHLMHGMVARTAPPAVRSRGRHADELEEEGGECLCVCDLLWVCAGGGEEACCCG